MSANIERSKSCFKYNKKILKWTPEILTKEEDIPLRRVCACASKVIQLNIRLICDTVKNLIEADNHLTEIYLDLRRLMHS